MNKMFKLKTVYSQMQTNSVDEGSAWAQNWDLNLAPPPAHMAEHDLYYQIWNLNPKHIQKKTCGYVSTVPASRKVWYGMWNCVAMLHLPSLHCPLTNKDNDVHGNTKIKKVYVYSHAKCSVRWYLGTVTLWAKCLHQQHRVSN